MRMSSKTSSSKSKRGSGLLPVHIHLELEIGRTTPLRLRIASTLLRQAFSMTGHMEEQCMSITTSHSPSK